MLGMRRVRVRLFPLLRERDGVNNQKRLHAITNAAHDVANKQPQRTFYKTRVICFDIVVCWKVIAIRRARCVTAAIRRRRMIIVRHLIVESF